MAKINKVLVGESLVGDGNEVAHIDLIMGPRGSAAESAFTHALTNNKDGFTSLLAVIGPNLATKPHTVMFNKVTIKGAKQAVQMFGPAQHAVALAVADCVADGTIPIEEANDIFICVGVFIHWEAANDQKIHDFNHQAVKESIQRAVRRHADAAGGGAEPQHGQAPVLAEIAGAPRARRRSAGQGAARKRRAIQRTVVDRGRHEHGVHAKGLEALEVAGIAHAAGGDEVPARCLVERLPHAVERRPAAGPDAIERHHDHSLGPQPGGIEESGGSQSPVAAGVEGEDGLGRRGAHRGERFEGSDALRADHGRPAFA